MKNSNEQKPNHVTLQLPDYLDLYEFKKNMDEKGLVFKSRYNSYSHQCQEITYITENTACEEMREINENVNKLLDQSVNQCDKLRQEVAELKKIIVKNGSIAVVKNFSIWQFLAWRKTK